MDKQKAKEVAGWLEPYFFKAERSAEQREAIDSAAARLAEKYIPDAAIVAQATLDDNAEPSIVALHDEQLYLLSVAVPKEGDDATGELRAFHVAADTGTAQFEASYEPSGTAHKKAIWRFKLADGRGKEFDLTLETHKVGEPELAKELAEALGWQFPGESAATADAG